MQICIFFKSGVKFSKNAILKTPLHLLVADANHFYLTCEYYSTINNRGVGIFVMVTNGQTDGHTFKISIILIAMVYNTP